MEFTEMTVSEMEARLAAIATEVEAEDADLDSLENETRSIRAEMDRRKAAEEQRNKIREEVAEGKGDVEQKFENLEEKKMDVNEIRNSHEYCEAFARYLKTGREEECRALLSTNATVSTGYVPVPERVEGRIRTAWERSELMNLVRKTYVKGNVRVGFELSGDPAYVHAEGATASTEEALTMGVVSLTPASIKKWITISDEAIDLSGEEFIDYIYDELTYRIAKKAQEELLGKIVALTASATSTAVGVGIVAGTPSVGLVAQAIGQLTDDASNPVVVMNKSSWAQFKAAQYAGSFNVDPFEGLRVVYDNTLPAYTSAGTAGSTWMVVGDFGFGAQANFPNGSEIDIKYDDLSLAEKDLVKLVGRQFVGLGIVGHKAFTKVTFPAGA